MTTAVLFALFALFAAAGAVARAAAIGRLNRPAFPVGTLAVNVAGCLALGALQGVGAPAATVVGTGFLGAFTTFSTFAADATALARAGRPATAAGYVTLSVVAGVAAAALGRALAP